MTIKRRVASTAAVFVLFAACFLAGIACSPGSASASEAVTPGEQAMVSAMMEARGMGAMVGCEALRDRSGEPSFLMGVSEDGYLIAERTTGLFMEQGDGPAPYSEGAAAKYYGGVLCYAEDVEGELTNSLTRDALDAVPYLPAAEEMVAEARSARTDADAAETASSTATASVTSTRLLPEYRDKIKAVAFGNNVKGELGNTCSAVALSIALNYLDSTFDGRLVPQDMELETRVSEGYISGSYPNADRFHRYLVDDCGLKPWYWTDTFTPGVWGDQLRNGCLTYLGRDGRFDVGLTLEWSVIDTGWVEESVGCGAPALITVSQTQWERPKYNNHTMVAYGCRTLSDGSKEINLHSGWYNSGATGYKIAGTEDKVWRINDIWAPLGIAAITYRFPLPDGWHCSGAGDWRYYEGGSYVTGWRDIDGKTYYFRSDGVRTVGYLTLGGIRYYFNSDGVLVSQTPVGSPGTGGSLGEAVAACLAARP